MRRNKLALYLHLVWATWDRQPLLTPEIERRVYRNIESEARGMGCTVLAINGMPDHTHLGLVIPTTITIANLVKQVKGVSSHFVNETLKPGFVSPERPDRFSTLEEMLPWRGLFGGNVPSPLRKTCQVWCSVSRWDVDKIVNYIKRQKEHHQLNELFPEWEEAFEEVNDSASL